MKILGVLNSFTAKVLLIFTVIFILSSAVPVGEDPQVINLCDTTFVLKKYTVYPPSGYFSSWFVNPEATIIGRWGELIFVSNALEYRWDGYYKGDLCQQDVYVFKIRYKARNFVSKAIYGRVLLLN